MLESSIRNRKGTTMIIRHITKLHWVNDILNDEVIKLEGCNPEADIKNRQQRRAIEKLLGRYVWFTESTVCNTAGCGNRPVAFVFNSEDIGAVPWKKFKQKFKTNKKRWAAINMLDLVAVMQGDDPDQYWISTKPVRVVDCIDVEVEG
jgi:hypothetical protein